MGFSSSSSSKDNINKNIGSQVVNDRSNNNMNDLLEKPTYIKTTIERPNLLSNNPVLKKELSFPNPNIDANAGLIQSKVNDAEIQKRQNIFMCPNQHDLTCDPPYKCLICKLEKAGLACQMC